MALGVEKFEACKEFTLTGRKYGRGELVDVSALLDYKVSQLLNQRYIRPAPGTVRDDALGT